MYIFAHWYLLVQSMFVCEGTMFSLVFLLLSNFQFKLERNEMICVKYTSIKS
jgi:hypothetical protein